VYVNPRPTEKAIQRYYNDDFYQTDFTAEQALESNRSRLDAMYGRVQHLRPGRVLDVGCYKGEFLYVMKSHGWDVHGVEFFSRPKNLFGLDIFYGPLEHAPFDPHSFDLVTLWAVLEHVYDPKETLRKIHRLLKTSGRLLVLVPNFRSIPGRWMRHDDVPRHTTMFTRRTLTEMLGMTGYKVKTIDCGQDIYSGSVRGFLNFLVKRLAGEDFDAILQQNRRAERWYEFARQLSGQDSRIMKKVDRLDQIITPFCDRWLDRFGLGFIMVAEAVPDTDP
jgi:SAM-dependent methyltransferase